MNAYLKIAASAIIASYIAPKLVNRFTRPEIDEKDAMINLGIDLGINAGVTAAVYAVAGAILGGPKATVAGDGGAT